MKKIFVFPSNEAGRHQAGPALFAVENHGALPGRGVGKQGSSYAIPVRNRLGEPLTIEQIAYYVEKFKEYARERDWLEFVVTPVGCGPRLYSHSEMATLFRDSPSNCNLPEEFKREAR